MLPRFLYRYCDRMMSDYKEHMQPTLRAQEKEVDQSRDLDADEKGVADEKSQSRAESKEGKADEEDKGAK